MDIETLLDNISNSDYTVGDIRICDHDENTRFVIVEKYPGKSKVEWEECGDLGGVFKRTLYVSIELVQPILELNITFELSQSNISHHLNILERAELISNYTRGKWKYYRITETGKELMKFI